MRKALGKTYRKVVPKNLQSMLDAKRASRFWNERGVIFVHVPKSAGMSISTSVYGRPLGHIAAKDIKKNQPQVFSKCFKFAFVRDPLSRYLSAWKYMQNNFSELEGGPGLPPRSFLNLDPVDFARYWLAGKDINDLNYIFRTQSFFLYDGGDLLLDYVARFENFNEEIAYLSEKVPQILSLSRINASGSEGVDVDMELLLSIIKSVYEEDYRLLGY